MMSNNNGGVVVKDKIKATAEASGADAASSDNVKIIDGIKIYPLRYGIFETNPNYKKKKEDGDDKVYFQSDNANVIIANENKFYRIGLDSFKSGFGVDNMETPLNLMSYHYYPMPLNLGYLYVSSKIDKGVYEFQCAAQGTLELLNFYGKETGAISAMEIGETNDFYIAKTDDEVSFFASPIRLTKTIILKKFYEKKDDLIKENTLDVKSWASEGKGGPGKYNLSSGLIDPSESYVIVPTSNHKYDSSEFNANELRVRNARTKNPVDKTKNRDLFFVIHDPWGIIEQLREDLLDAHLKHDAIIRSVKTGVNPENIYNNMLVKSEDNNIYYDSELTGINNEQLTQPAMIHHMAVSVYRFFYDSHDTKWLEYVKDARKQVYKDYLEKILAVKDRKEARFIIYNKQDALAAAVESEMFELISKYYVEVGVDGHDKSEEALYYGMIIHAKTMIADIFKVLATAPNAKDKHMDLSNVASDSDTNGSAVLNKIKEFLKKTEHSAHKILNTKIILEKYVDDLAKDLDASIPENADPYDEEDKRIRDIIDRDGKTIKITDYINMANSIMDAFQKAAFDEFEIKSIVDMIETPETKDFFITEKDAVKKVINESKYFKAVENLDEQFESFHKNGKVYVKVKTNNSKELKNGIIRVKVVKQNPGIVDRISRAVCTNKLWNGMVDSIFLLSVKDVISDFDKKHPVRAVFGSMAYTTSLVKLVDTYEIIKIAPKKGFAGKILGSAARKNAAFGAVGGALGAITDSWDAIVLIGNDDADAGVAAVLGALAGVGSTTISLFFASAAWAGPAGIALAILAVAAKICVTFLTDTPLEAFVKDTVFYKKYLVNADTPYKLIAELSKEKVRSQMLDDDKAYLSDYRYQVDAFLYQHSGLYDLKLTKSNFKSITYKGGSVWGDQGYDKFLYCYMGCEIIVQINKYLFNIKEVSIGASVVFDTNYDWVRRRQCDEIPLDSWPVEEIKLSKNQIIAPEVKNYCFEDNSDESKIAHLEKDADQLHQDWINARYKSPIEVEEKENGVFDKYNTTRFIPVDALKTEKDPFIVREDKDFIPFAFRDSFRFKTAGMTSSSSSSFYLILTLKFTNNDGGVIPYQRHDSEADGKETLIIYKYHVEIPRVQVTDENKEKYYVHDMEQLEINKEKVVVNTLKSFYEDEF